MALNLPLTGGKYDFIPVIALFGFTYCLSFLLYRRGTISVRAHRMVWNIMLLVTFLFSAGSGILLILRINYGIVLPSPSTLYWHVESGIAMTVISVFHILWHWEYYSLFVSGILKRGRKTRETDGSGKAGRSRKHPFKSAGI